MWLRLEKADNIVSKATGWKAGMIFVGSGEPLCVPTSMLVLIYQGKYLPGPVVTVH